MSTLARAIAIAAEAHVNQVDKAGAPYILHPLRLMFRVEGNDAKIVAVLHDVVEDGPGWSFERLRGQGFPEAVLAALECVTKRPEEQPDEMYMAFIARAAGNPIARQVKLADLEDNMDVSRIAQLTEKDVRRLEKYHRAWAWLKAQAAA
jgi:(p)ppGpp synthase/HD superfamily hydrolase